MKKDFFILLVIALCGINGYSQNLEYHLNLDFSGMKNYEIQVSKSRSDTLLIVKKVKSDEKFNFSTADSLKLRKLLKGKREDVKLELSNLINKYRRYEVDTVVIESQDPLIQLTDSFVENWNERRKRLELNPDERIIIDGYTAKFSLKKNGTSYEDIYASTPTSKSHPEIAELIRELENFYRAESRNPIIK